MYLCICNNLSLLILSSFSSFLSFLPLSSQLSHTRVFLFFTENHGSFPFCIWWLDSVMGQWLLKRDALTVCFCDCLILFLSLVILYLVAYAYSAYTLFLHWRMLALKYGCFASDLYMGGYNWTVSKGRWIYLKWSLD